MLLTIEVERHRGEYVEPRIEDHESGCVFHIHEDDITAEGAVAFADALTSQARRWTFRSPDVPRGPRIPISMELREDMPEGIAIVIDDRPDSIKYKVRAGLIKQHAGDAITTSQSERSPDWQRVPAQYIAHLKAS
ncbi:hypothetical protein ACFWY6_39850 [Streptomyces sp. NPDC059037]|uniref:hypothetical protein n=1 Tax=Streptomyces sp. NPDC059037 TaxID=3346710 RepID=UPI003676DCC8